MKTFEFTVRLFPDDGMYVIYAVRLPECMSQGETIQEALDNIQEAFELVVEAYLEDEGEIPWQEPDKEDEEDLKIPGAFDTLVRVEINVTQIKIQRCMALQDRILGGLIDANRSLVSLSDAINALTAATRRLRDITEDLE